ncbi:MAG: bifunctional DNA-formamidopyrimidine glycosylase/DNA-(apurinic or apyrimidinic site) lyase [Planctomycetia bacterium]|jgi:formamidopyrimidine-DNA glycosylase|nr:bifunctional DNA-formamidopyrimidine glycosylase/DNA-(apurinic or apyrimidinic site) lyase [Planctomycetia bacterium]
MPELPEVEAVRRQLAMSILDRTVERVRVHRRDVVRDTNGRRRGRISSEQLGVDRRIRRIGRRGKQLIIEFDGDHGLIVRLGMSGRIEIGDAGARRTVPPHRHVAWTIAGGSGRPRLRMEFIDPRRFGGVHLFESPEDRDQRVLSRLGPEATLIDGKALGGRLKASERAIKAALLDQQVLAGIGNIYADESLFRSGIRPDRPACDLSDQDLARLARCIRTTLGRAIDAGGTTLRDHRLPDGSSGTFSDGHLAYGRSGQPCTRCRVPMVSSIVAGRTTTWCDSCQA